MSKELLYKFVRIRVPKWLIRKKKFPFVLGRNENELEGKVRNETEKAIMFDDRSLTTKSSHGVWLPKSQIEILDVVEKLYDLEVIEE